MSLRVVPDGSVGVFDLDLTLAVASPTNSLDAIVIIGHSQFGQGADGLSFAVVEAACRYQTVILKTHFEGCRYKDFS
jgi:hypothetical protein